MKKTKLRLKAQYAWFNDNKRNEQYKLKKRTQEMKEDGAEKAPRIR